MWDFYVIFLSKGGIFLKNRIKQIRKENKLTQSEFGERIGVKGNTIGNYELGLRNPTDAVILSICREFNIAENWLRTGEEPKYTIINDDYTKISADIDRNDPKARQAIIDYWNLSKDNKELWWNWVEKFLRKNNGG